MHSKPNNLINEQRLVTRIDWKVMPWLCLLYALSFLDRINIGHARLLGLEKSLRLEDGQFGWCLSIFYIGYILCEIPSNLLLKKTTPPIWFSRIAITWGVITMSMAATSNFEGLLSIRFFLGIAEAGLFPGILYYLSFWYTRSDQAIRLCIVFLASSLAGILAGLIAFGIGCLDEVAGLKSWQWLFILEGLPTLIVGGMVWYFLPGIPKTTNWLKEEERMILLNRLERSHVPITHNPINLKQLFNTFKDIKTYLYILLTFCSLCPLNSVTLLLPSLIKDLGFTSLNAMLLSMPPYLLGMVVSIIVSYSSDRYLERGYHISFCYLISITGYIILITKNGLIVSYFGLTLAMVGSIAGLSPIFSWSNNNLIGSTRSVIGSGLIGMSASLAGFVGSQFYRTSEAPIYMPSHSANLSLLVFSLILVAIIKIYLKFKNRKLTNQNKVCDIDRTIFDRESEGQVRPTFTYIL